MTGYESKRAAARDKLAQPAQEPPKYSFKAYLTKDNRIGVVACVVRPDGGVHILEEIIDLPQRPWVGLMDADISAAYVAWNDTNGTSFADFARAIEAKLKEKNK
jgi:hypothetical protein